MKLKTKFFMMILIIYLSTAVCYAGPPKKLIKSFQGSHSKVDVILESPDNIYTERHYTNNEKIGEFKGPQLGLFVSNEYNFNNILHKRMFKDKNPDIPNCFLPIIETAFYASASDIDIADAKVFLYTKSPFMPNGSLYDYITELQEKGTKPSPAQQIIFSYGLASALDYMHTKQKILHRDVTLKNVMLDRYMHPFIRGFENGVCCPTNCSKVILAINLPDILSNYYEKNENDGKFQEHANRVIHSLSQRTLEYRCPETCKENEDKNHWESTKSDIYQYGLCLSEIISGKTMLQHCKDMDLPPRQIEMIFNRTEDPREWFYTPMHKYKDNYIRKQLKKLSSNENIFESSMADIALKCLNKNPESRPDAAEIINKLKEIIKLPPYLHKDSIDLEPKLIDYINNCLHKNPANYMIETEMTKINSSIASEHTGTKFAKDFAKDRRDTLTKGDWPFSYTSLEPPKLKDKIEQTAVVNFWENNDKTVERIFPCTDFSKGCLSVALLAESSYKFYEYLHNMMFNTKGPSNIPNCILPIIDVGFFISDVQDSKINVGLYTKSPLMRNDTVAKITGTLCKDGGPTKSEQMKYAYGVAKAISFMHTLNPCIIHGDIKPDNVLLDRNSNPFLCDFDSITKYDCTSNTTSIFQCDNIEKYTSHFNIKDLNHAYKDLNSGPYIYSAPYVCPEFLETDSAKFSPKSDVYQYGLYLYELITGSSVPLFQRFLNIEDDSKKIGPHDNNFLLVHDYIRDHLKSIPSAAPSGESVYQFLAPSESKKDSFLSSMATLALNCINKDPEKRPDMSNVLAQLDEIIKNSDPEEGIQQTMNEYFSSCLYRDPVEYMVYSQLSP